MSVDLYERIKSANPVPRSLDYDHAEAAAILARIVDQGSEDLRLDSPSDPDLRIDFGPPPRSLVSDLGAILVVVLVAGGLLLGLGRILPQDVVSAPSGSASMPAADSSGRTSAAMGLLSYRGVSVPVPQAMLDSANAPCNQAIRDAAYIVQPNDPDLYSLCAPAIDPDGQSSPEQLTQVILMATEAADRIAQNGGYRYVDGESTLGDGRTQIVTTFDTHHVLLIVISPDSLLARTFSNNASD